MSAPASQRHVSTGQRHDQSGGGGNRTLPNRLEPSGSVGSTDKVSGRFWFRWNPSDPDVDAVNTTWVTARPEPKVYERFVKSARPRTKSMRYGSSASCG